MIVILTGASRGLGLSILRILLERNVRVTTLSRTITPELQQLSNDNLQIVQGDVGSPQDNQRAIDQTIERWGGIDGLILNAGSINPGEFGLLACSSQLDSRISTSLKLPNTFQRICCRCCTWFSQPCRSSANHQDESCSSRQVPPPKAIHHGDCIAWPRRE